MAVNHSSFGIPVISHPDTVEHRPYYTVDLEVILNGAETGGQYFVTRNRHLSPQDAPPLHRHSNEDEIWLVHGGQFRFWIGGTSLDTATVHDVGAGGVVYGPRGVAHTFQSMTEGQGDVTIIWSPAESERYFLSVGESDERHDFDEPDRLTDIGVEVLDRAPIRGE